RVLMMSAPIKLPPLPEVGGTEVPVDIAVQYLAGGPAAALPVILRAQIRDRQPPTLDDFEHATFANGPVKEGIVRQSESDEEEAAPNKPGVHQREQLRLDPAGSAHAQTANLPAVSALRQVTSGVEYRGSRR